MASPASAASGLDPSDVLAQLAVAVQSLANASQATASAAAASSAQPIWKESKFVKSPDTFSAKTLEDELALWPDWSFQFKAFMCVQDGEYKTDFRSARRRPGFLTSVATARVPRVDLRDCTPS